MIDTIAINDVNDDVLDIVAAIVVWGNVGNDKKDATLTAAKNVFMM